MVFHRCVFYQCDLLSGWSHQCDLLSVSSFIGVVSHQCGPLSGGLSSVFFYFYWGGLLSGCLSSVSSFIRVVSHQCRLLSGSLLISMVFHHGGLSSVLFFIRGFTVVDVTVYMTNND